MRSALYTASRVGQAALNNSGRVNSSRLTTSFSSTVPFSAGISRPITNGSGLSALSTRPSVSGLTSRVSSSSTIAWSSSIPRRTVGVMAAALPMGGAMMAGSSAMRNSLFETASPSTSSSVQSAVASFSSADLPEHSVIGMPALSPTMTSGTIASWNVEEGTEVAPGDVLAEIVTDKATVALECQEDGFLAKILEPANDSELEVGTPIALIVSEEEDIPKMKDFVPEAAPGGASTEDAAPPAPAAPAAPVSVPTPAPSAPAPPATSAAPAPAAPSGGAEGRVFSTPFARKVASEAGVSVNNVTGSGPNGRVVADDVRAAIAAGTAAAPAASAAAPAAALGASLSAGVSDKGPYTDMDISRIRHVIADRLVESKTTVPHYYLTVEIEMDDAMAVRAELNSDAEKEGRSKISINDFVIKAAALAAGDVPLANATWTDSAIRMYHNVDVNVAVQTPHGLLTPVVRNCHIRGLNAIASDVRGLAAIAKEGALTPEQLSVGTITVSNLGMFGIKHFSAIILPPQACILAVGAVEPTLLPPHAGSDAEFRTANVMSVTMSCDHRVVDGAVGAEYLAALKGYLQKPLRMLL